MSAHSPANSFFEISGFYPESLSEALPAKTSAPPTPKVKASKASAAASTSKQPASSEKSALVGSLLRTALISELEAQTSPSLHWKNSATPAGRLWSVLATSAPTMSGPGLGSLGATLHKLPTPMASDGMKDGKGGGAGSTYPFRKILATPRASDASHGPEISKAAASKSTGVSLVTMLEMGKREMLSTPRASDMKAGGHGDTGRMGSVRHQLQKASENLPTPTKRDKRMDRWSPAYDKRKSPTMDAVLDGAMTGRAPGKWDYAREIASMLSDAGLTGPSMTLPITYGWMLGYPPGWLSRALQSAVQEGLLQHPSSLKRSATR